MNACLYVCISVCIYKLICMHIFVCVFMHVYVLYVSKCPSANAILHVPLFWFFIAFFRKTRATFRCQTGLQREATKHKYISMHANIAVHMYTYIHMYIRAVDDAKSATTENTAIFNTNNNNNSNRKHTVKKAKTAAWTQWMRYICKLMKNICIKIR